MNKEGYSCIKWLHHFGENFGLVTNISKILVWGGKKWQGDRYAWYDTIFMVEKHLKLHRGFFLLGTYKCKNKSMCVTINMKSEVFIFGEGKRIISKDKWTRKYLIILVIFNFCYTNHRFWDVYIAFWNLWNIP